jgi:uncharacterized protein (TIGR03067 family)
MLDNQRSSANYKTMSSGASNEVSRQTRNVSRTDGDQCSRWKCTLQGKWTAVKAEQDGREAVAIVGHRLQFEGDAFSIQEKGVTIYEGTFNVDASASHDAIDFKHTGDASRGKTWRGIYKFDGDTLTICDNAGDVQKSRPASFETKPTSGLVLVVFKRAN